MEPDPTAQENGSFRFPALILAAMACIGFLVWLAA